MTRSLHSPAYRHVTEALKAMRHDAGLSQRELASILDRELSFVSRIEQGQRRLDLLEWTWFCEALGRDPAEEARKLVNKLKRIKPRH